MMFDVMQHVVLRTYKYLPPVSDQNMSKVRFVSKGTCMYYDLQPTLSLLFTFFKRKQNIKDGTLSPRKRRDSMGYSGISIQ